MNDREYWLSNLKKGDAVVVSPSWNKGDAYRDVVKSATWANVRVGWRLFPRASGIHSDNETMLMPPTPKLLAQIDASSKDSALL